MHPETPMMIMLLFTLYTFELYIYLFTLFKISFC